MTTTIEQAARVIAEAGFPDLWQDNPSVAHQAASPLSVSDARRNCLNLARSHAQALSDAGLLAKKPVDPPA